MVLSEKYPASSIQFPLTFRGVRYKQHSAAFPNQVCSFNPIRKENQKWSTIAQKSRYSRQKEYGILFSEPGKMQILLLGTWGFSTLK